MSAERAAADDDGPRRRCSSRGPPSRRCSSTSLTGGPRRRAPPVHFPQHFPHRPRSPGPLSPRLPAPPTSRRSANAAPHAAGALAGRGVRPHAGAVELLVAPRVPPGVPPADAQRRHGRVQHHRAPGARRRGGAGRRRVGGGVCQGLSGQARAPSPSLSSNPNQSPDARAHRFSLCPLMRCARTPFCRQRRRLRHLAPNAAGTRRSSGAPSAPTPRRSRCPSCPRSSPSRTRSPLGAPRRTPCTARTRRPSAPTT